MNTIDITYITPIHQPKREIDDLFKHHHQTYVASESHSHVKIENKSHPQNHGGFSRVIPRWFNWLVILSR